MSSYSKDIINRINAIPILDVAKRLDIDVKNKHTICWLHGDTDPSLSFDTRRNKWKCFGCDAGGGVIDLVTARTGLFFPDACQWLCDEFNILSNSHRPKKTIPIRTAVESVNEFLPDPEVYEWIINNTGISEKAKKYITELRHFPDSIIEQYKIRSSRNNDGLLAKCIEKFGQERLLKCGVAKVRKTRGGESFIGFVWFGEVILFPYFNQEDRIIYIQARKIDSASTCKYICLHRIETVPYNIQVLNNLGKSDIVVICEGVFDCISLGLLGKNAVGIIGASGFKAKYISLLKHFTIVVIPDNDDAGAKFAHKIERDFLKIGKVVKILPLPQDSKDITEYYDSRKTR
jgi:DNA primase